MKVFITGATGFIGQPLARALLRRGWQVTALVRRPEAPRAQALQSAGVTLAQGDIVASDRQALRAAMQSADLVFHNAGWYELGVTRAAHALMRATNVQGSEAILELACELGVPKIAYTSTTTALGDTAGAVVGEDFTRYAPPLSFYEQTKVEAHGLAIAYQARGAPLVIACPAQVIGPGDHSAFGYFARLYVRGLLPPIAWAPDGAFTMAHVDDVAEGLALAAERGRPGQTYFLAGEVIRNREIVATWAQTPGGLKRPLWLPWPLALLAGTFTAPLLRLLGLPAFISREVVISSYVSFRYSSGKAEQELGVHFRGARQAWRETLDAERLARGRPA